MKIKSQYLMAVAAPLFLTFLAPNAKASLFEYTASLNGAIESPTNASPATGFADVIYNNTAHTLEVEVTFSGLLGPTTASHIHAATSSPFSGTAGVATTTPYFAGFPIGVTSGSYSNTLDLTLSSSWNSSYITSTGGTPATAEAALFAAMNAGEAYLNIHSSFAPGGEIRGFLVPEPSSAVLLGAGALAAWKLRRRTGRS